MAVEEKNLKQLFVIREWGRNLGFNLEIRKCLEEYYGIENVDVLIIPNHARADIAIMDAIHQTKPINVFFDSRIFIVDAKIFALTKHLNHISTLNINLKKAKVIPICIVTDAQAPGYCFVADLLTDKIGYIVPIGSEFRFKSRKRNHKLHGLFNPISESTAVFLKSNTQAKNKNIYFGGSLYEPRKSFFTEVKEKLDRFGIQAEISSKKPDSYRDYLKDLAEHKIVLNTNFIANSREVHMVGRNIETLNAGALLITQETPILEKYFQKGKHYIHASTPFAAAEIINYFLNHPDELSLIAKNGQVAALQYATDRLFVSSIDQFVRKHGLRSKSWS
jgi:hypothetical protein